MRFEPGSVARAVAFAACPAIILLLKRRWTFQDAESATAATALQQLAKELLESLRSGRPKSIEGVSPDLHELPPFVPKAFWTKIGDVLQPHERPEVQRIPGERFITLRLDGSCFSKLTRRLSALGVLESGYSEDFAGIMRDCCTSLMSKTNAKCGYTQSDEMTVVIGACSVVRGEQQCHMNGGRVLKLCTHAASHVTALFNFKLQGLFSAKGICMEESLLASFDCRLGHYATLEEAATLVLWRAADCGVNGVSDAVYKSKGRLAGAKQIMGKSTDEKLQWLAANGLLPLKAHQAHGSFFVKTKRPSDGFNPKTGLSVHCVRSQIEQVPGNVLRRAAEGALFPEVAEES
mmetsp:Transcript_93033/g.165476  ORF Transcript_93033/g.165476 Transcript_93033/m.165476 type:complete len:348 (+) Transcript_93033:50-1093(+)|eukprot:CAMPEP_0197687546 /NCGR_PEP_ID=MMETSP1338-20131121/104121_1 /TAXON_ID=43686 ORGANISM="Pelagodinium beii, Strain RCC1491" /NCGR_SAMPLE_ID=MMETSP1338 /ASSEMBLY_ACC=CAM_ASM_000754 /LENGTH=347 /DNA_ID=CAMNT_0043269659 /DNA_START=38 /DNA_END=1081 /DNA_ORIENTATION=+